MWIDAVEGPYSFFFSFFNIFTFFGRLPTSFRLCLNVWYDDKNETFPAVSVSRLISRLEGYCEDCFLGSFVVDDARCVGWSRSVLLSISKLSLMTFALYQNLLQLLVVSIASSTRKTAHPSFLFLTIAGARCCRD